MRFPKTLTFLMLATALVFALPARAQHSHVAQGPHFGPAALPSNCNVKALPPEAQQKPVAPGFSPASAHVAASLPRHGGVKPPLRHADLKVSPTTPGTGPAKPFTPEQVVSMVRDEFGDKSGAKLIAHRGIDFAWREDFFQSLKPAAANEAFLNALHPPPSPQARERAKAGQPSAGTRLSGGPSV
jgi:hypothetical protein